MTKESISAIARKYKKHYEAECRQKYLEEWRISGLSMSEYCHRHDLALSTLSKWNQRQGEPLGLKLKPLKPVRPPMPLLPSALLLEIRLPNSIRIRLGQAEDATTFKKILEAIQSCNEQYRHRSFGLLISRWILERRLMGSANRCVRTGNGIPAKGCMCFITATAISSRYWRGMAMASSYCLNA